MSRSPFDPIRASRVGSGAPVALGELVGDTLDWITDEAACRGADPEAFFPTPGGSDATAKAICGTCPLVEQCLAYALPRPTVQGIWGAMNDTDRASLRRRMGISNRAVGGHQPAPACGTENGARRHTRRQEPRCEPCREAATLANRERREAKARAAQVAA